MFSLLVSGYSFGRFQQYAQFLQGLALAAHAAALESSSWRTCSFSRAQRPAASPSTHHTCMHTHACTHALTHTHIGWFVQWSASDETAPYEQPSCSLECRFPARSANAALQPFPCYPFISICAWSKIWIPLQGWRGSSLGTVSQPYK